MKWYAFLVPCIFALGLLTPVQAQSSNDIVKKLERPPEIKPTPGLRELPFGKKGVTIVEPHQESPPTIDLYISFDFNSDKLTPDAILILRQLGEALKDPRLAKDRFKIAGHTDAKGTFDYNQKLSERRARAVRDYLVFQYDIDRGRLESLGYGKTQLKDPAHPLDGINRRVQVINTGSTMAN